MVLLESCTAQAKNLSCITRYAFSRIKSVQMLLYLSCSNRMFLNLERGFHSTSASCKYHDLRKARMLSKRKMDMLQARLDRLDKEDRPTGCILCPMRNDIKIDHKNVRLLSQFISPHTGRIYGSTVTGLCQKKQKEVAKAIKRSRSLGFMPTTMKYFEFHNDPKIFWNAWNEMTLFWLLVS